MTVLLVDGAVKVCSACKVEKPLDAFYANKYGKYGRHSRCKPCGNKATVKSRGKNLPRQREYDNARYRKTAQQVRETNLWSMYRITGAQYDEMVRAQEGKCAICRRAPDGKGMASRLHVDHDHETKVVRGLLCSRCNIAIGLFKEDPVRMNNAIAYLMEHST